MVVGEYIGSQRTPSGARPSSVSSNGSNDTAPTRVWRGGKGVNAYTPDSLAPVELSAITEQKETSPKSPRSGERSPRPTSFPIAKMLADGPVKTTEIKSPEEVTGVKSPSPESWTVQMDTGGALTWMNGTVAHTGLTPPNGIVTGPMDSLLSGPLSI